MSNRPKATHSGNWVINPDSDLIIQCYVMDNGERVLSLRGTAKSMGLVGGGSGALVRNINSKWISPYLSDNLRDWLEKANRNELPDYITDKGRPFTPFSASNFVDLCKAYVDAMHDNVSMVPSQRMVAERLYAIMTAFAKVGLIAVIDEVTGFQDDRDKNELQKILAEYVNEEMLPWAKRFPDEFYKQMFRLKGWTYRGKSRNAYAGKLTNKFIYEYMPKGVLEELRKRNPKNEETHRRKKYHHQFLTENTGLPHLDKQMQQTIALMRASDDWNEFEKLFGRSMDGVIQQSLFDKETDKE